MEKIANLDDIKSGRSLFFNYKDKKAIMIRPEKDKVVAYVAVCPHEGGNIEWDETISKILCECHLSLFNVEDGSVYRHSSLFELKKGLTEIQLKIDENRDIYTI